MGCIRLITVWSFKYQELFSNAVFIDFIGKAKNFCRKEIHTRYIWPNTKSNLYVASIYLNKPYKRRVRKNVKKSVDALHSEPEPETYIKQFEAYVTCS